MSRRIALIHAALLLLPGLAAAQPALTVVRAAPPATMAPAENFTGTVHVGEIFRGSDPARAYGGTVSFEAGSRTHWHTHALGQTLLVTAGTGFVQLREGDAEEIRVGDVVVIPPGVQHWHGASPHAAMTHLAMSEAPATGTATEWLEAVTEEQYNSATAPVGAGPGPIADQPSRAQQLMGDIAPGLAALTDDVLYGQVWADRNLSQRDRSLVTVSALIALDRPDQLRSPLGIARRNGLTLDQAVAAITHLAFYAGWPNAVTAVSIAREIYAEPDGNTSPQP